MAAIDDHAVEWHLARRTDAPSGDDRMLLSDVGAQEMDCARVLQRRGLDDARTKTLAGIFVDDERSVGARDRAEESGRGVGNELGVLGGDIEAIDVRDAR